MSSLENTLLFFDKSSFSILNSVEVNSTLLPSTKTSYFSVSIINIPPPPEGGGVGSPGSPGSAPVVNDLIVESVVIPPLTRSDLTYMQSQRARVLWLMLDGFWHSATEIITWSRGREGLRRMRELREIPHITIERHKHRSSPVQRHKSMSIPIISSTPTVCQPGQNIAFLSENM